MGSKFEMRRLEVEGRVLARNTLLNFVGLLIPLSLGIVTIPLMVRGLGAERFGLLSLAWVILGYFTVFDLGLGRATTKYVAEAMGRDDGDQVPRLVWTATTVQAVLGLLGAVILVGFVPLAVEHLLHASPALVGEAKAVLYLLAAAIPMVLLASSFSGALEAAQRFDLVNIVRIPLGAGTFLMPVVGLMLGLKLPGIVALILALRLAALLGFGILALHVLPELRKFSANFALFPRLLAYGGWVTVTNVLGPVLLYFDRFAVASSLSLADAAYYTAPLDMVLRLGIIPGGLVMTLFPAFSTLGTRRKGDVHRLYVRSIKYVLLVAGPTVLVLVSFAGIIIRTWLGSDFVDRSTLVFQILLLGILGAMVAPISVSLLQGLGRPDVTPKLYIIEVPLNAILVLFLVREMGLVGAALSFALRALVETAFLFAISWRLVGLSPTTFRDNGLWHCLGALLGLGTLLWVISSSHSSSFQFAFSAAMVLLVFAASAWRFALDSTDRHILSSALIRFDSNVGA